MQKQQTVMLRKAAKEYVTVVKHACANVKGFSELYKELERSININGKSKSALIYNSRRLVNLALHYKCMPLDLDADQVMDYLHLVKNRGTESASFEHFDRTGKNNTFNSLHGDYDGKNGCNSGR